MTNNTTEMLSDAELAQVSGGYGCAGHVNRSGYEYYGICDGAGVQQSSSGLQHEPVHAK